MCLFGALVSEYHIVLLLKLFVWVIFVQDTARILCYCLNRVCSPFHQVTPRHFRADILKTRWDSRDADFLKSLLIIWLLFERGVNSCALHVSHRVHASYRVDILTSRYDLQADVKRLWIFARRANMLDLASRWVRPTTSSPEIKPSYL